MLTSCRIISATSKPNADSRLLPHHRTKNHVENCSLWCRIRHCTFLRSWRTCPSRAPMAPPSAAMVVEANRGQGGRSAWHDRYLERIGLFRGCFVRSPHVLGSLSYCNSLTAVGGMGPLVVLVIRGNCQMWKRVPSSRGGTLFLRSAMLGSHIGAFFLSFQAGLWLILIVYASGL